MSDDRFAAKPSQESIDRLTKALERERKYPNCAKLSARREDILIIGRFLDWCGEEHGLKLRRVIGLDVEDVQGTELTHLIQKYFDIDPVKLEEERAAMLEDL